MENKRLLYAYTLTSFVSVTAYEVYQATLANYNFGFALVGFQSVALLILRFAYPHVERVLLNSVYSNKPEPNSVAFQESDQNSLSLLATVARQPFVVPLLGLINCLRFGLMLPFLQTIDNSLLFIVFFSLSGLLRVPVAMWVFGDRVTNSSLYATGLLLATLGGIAYAVNPLQPLNVFTGNWQLLSAVLIRVPLEIFDSILTRYVATPNVSRHRTVPVQSIESVKAIFSILFGLLIGLWMADTHLDVSFIPTGSQWFGILWIGIVVTLTSTFSTRLLIEVTHTVTQPILSARPLLAFIPFAFLYLKGGGSPIDLSYKLICLLVVLAGTMICLRNGQPTRLN